MRSAPTKEKLFIKTSNLIAHERPCRVSERNPKRHESHVKFDVRTKMRFISSY